MKGIRFYEEFSDKRNGVSEGNVVAVMCANGANLRGEYDALVAVFPRANSPTEGTTVSPGYLRERCKRVGELRARRIHPALFARLDQAPYRFRMVRTVRFTPFIKGAGPIFTLQLFDAERTDDRGAYGVCFRLLMAGKPLFEAMTSKGAFYGHSAVDSDEAIKGVMSFLTLKPGDTDDDYFNRYTKRQRFYCEKYAEALSLEVENRFGEDA